MRLKGIKYYVLISVSAAIGVLIGQYLFYLIGV
jgi:hypothetical protein